MDLSQQEWSEKLNADDNSQILDVRTDEACAILKSQGFENCYNLLGGITEWEGETVS